MQSKGLLLQIHKQAIPTAICYLFIIHNYTWLSLIFVLPHVLRYLHHFSLPYPSYQSAFLGTLNHSVFMSSALIVSKQAGDESFLLIVFLFSSRCESGTLCGLALSRARDPVRPSSKKTSISTAITCSIDIAHCIMFIDECLAPLSANYPQNDNR